MNWRVVRWAVLAYLGVVLVLAYIFVVTYLTEGLPPIRNYVGLALVFGPCAALVAAMVPLRSGHVGFSGPG